MEQFAADIPGVEDFSSLPTVNSENTSDDEEWGDYKQICVENVMKKMNEACPEYERSVLGSLLFQFIKVNCNQKISRDMFESIDTIFSEKGSLITKEVKKFEFNVEVVLKASLVYAVSLQARYNYPVYLDPATFFADYQQYLYVIECPVDPTEMAYLLNFRRFMKISLDYIPAKRNKQLLIAICALLEGSGRVYITGGTQSVATSWRTYIFEYESGLEKVCRPSRSKAGVAAAAAAAAAVAGEEPGGGTGEEQLRKREDMAKKKKMITCDCGAVILRRTMWKHAQSKRHIQFQVSTQCISILQGGVDAQCLQ